MKFKEVTIYRLPSKILMVNMDGWNPVCAVNILFEMALNFNKIYILQFTDMTISITPRKNL